MLFNPQKPLFLFPPAPGLAPKIIIKKLFETPALNFSINPYFFVAPYGFEPQLIGSEPIVLPLDDRAVKTTYYTTNVII